MKRALVLGAGGAAGLAWEAGVVAGLLDGGIDVRDADLVIGTSAGAVVGAQIARGIAPDEVARAHRASIGGDAAGRVPRARDVTGIQAIFGLWATFHEMTPERQRQIAQLALSAETMPERDWVDSFTVDDAWPAKPLLVPAVSCDTGELRVFDSRSGVRCRLAVAASCAVPGIFPPVTIGGTRYTDGVVRSGTSADLAQRIEPDIALIVTVFGIDRPGINRTSARALARETGELEAAGVAVRTIRFDEAAQAVTGGNMMDPAARLPALDAGLAHGRAMAPSLAAWWRGR